MALEVIHSRNALSGAESDGLRFSHLQLIIRTDFGREKFGAGIESLWRRIIDDPNAFPPEFWQLFLHPNLITLGEKCCPECVGMTWRRLFEAGTMRYSGTTAGGGQPRSETFWSRSTRGGGTGSATRKNTSRGKQLADPHRLLQRIQHSEADCYASGGSHLRAGAYTVRGKLLRRDVCARVFQMESGERRKIHCSSGVQQGDAMGPALFCMPLLPVLKRTRAEFEPRDVEAFAYLDDISIGMMKITPDTVEVVPFLQRELSNIGIAINTSKTVALPPKGHVPNILPFLRALASASPNVVGLRWWGYPSAQMST